MALSVSATPMFQRMTFSAAASGGTAPLVSESQVITCLTPGIEQAPTSGRDLGTQFITVYATMSGAAATATLSIFGADADSVGGSGDGKFFQDTAAIAAGSLRQSHNTAAGDYVATATFAISGKNTLDLFPGNGPLWPQFYVACTALSAGTLKVLIAPGRAI